MENENRTLTERILTTTSKVISVVCCPFLIPFAAFAAIFLFTYLRVPYEYKLIVLGIVFCFTVLMPVMTIFLFLRMSRMTDDPGKKSKRYMPYLLSIISFIFCAIMMHRLNIPWYMNSVILASILTMIVFLLTNLKLNISIYMGGMGAVIGGIVSFSGLFGYNPVWLLCIFILIAGLVGSARIILGRHTLNEIMAGFTVGFVCTLIMLHPTTSLFLQLLF